MNSCFFFSCNQGYVTEGIPATQRYLQTSLKLQIELISVYRHVILLSGATALTFISSRGAVAIVFRVGGIVPLVLLFSRGVPSQSHGTLWELLHLPFSCREDFHSHARSFFFLKFIPDDFVSVFSHHHQSLTLVEEHRASTTNFILHDSLLSSVREQNFVQGCKAHEIKCVLSRRRTKSRGTKTEL